MQALARDVLVQGSEKLRRAGVAEPDLDAEVLLRHVLGWDRAALLTRSAEKVSAGAVSRFDELVARRAAREPLQYITGVQAFWKAEFVVTPAVLIPRPETEILVERALRLLDGTVAPVVIDVGTGSGCIALSLAAERPDATVHAVDVSPAALAVARENAARLGLEVRFHEADLLAGAAAWARGATLVVSNPPYVSAEERPSLMPEVRDHEPPSALFAPGDPLHFYKRLIEESRPLLCPGGALAVEIGAGRAPAVVDLMRGGGFEVVAVDRDLQGIERVVAGAR